MQRIALFLLVFLTTAAMADPADDVRCREIGFSKSVENRDLRAFRSFIDTDARFISDQVRRGRSEISDGWSPFMEKDGPRIKWRPRFVEVLEDGKLAMTRGLYRISATNEDGSESVAFGSFNSPWRLNDDGEWRVVFDAGDPAARPPSPEEQALLDQEDDCE